MALYCGIDLHSNNSYVAVLDDDDQVVGRGRVANDLEAVLQALEPHRAALCGVVVESTYNWYWLVDGLMDAGYRLHLANPAAIQRYKGLKYSDDSTDAAWLAHLLRLGLLPEGHIYPKATRPVRDLLRRRSQLVRTRAPRSSPSRRNWRGAPGAVRRQPDQADGRPRAAPAGGHTRAGPGDRQQPRGDAAACTGRSPRSKRRCWHAARLQPAFVALKTVVGIGDVLGLTIALETGDIGTLRRGRQLRLVLPLRWQRVAKQRQAQGPRQYQERQQVAGPGGLSRRRTSRCASRRRPSAITSGKRRRPSASWRSRRWQTSWPGPAFT